MKYKIALDTIGSDKGAVDFVFAARKFASDHQDAEITLVGDKTEIISILNEPEKYPNIKIVEATANVTATDPITIFKTNPQYSLFQVLDLLEKNICGAGISAASTKHVFASSIFLLGTTDAIKRPGIMVKLPILLQKNAILLDVGANVSLTEEQIIDLLHLACDHIQTDNKPVHELKIGFLVPNKSQPRTRFDFDKVQKLLSKQNKVNLENICILSPSDVLEKPVDIIFTDGWAGNIYIKSIEGTSLTWLQYIKQLLPELMKQSAGSNNQLSEKILPLFEQLKTKFDYQKLGGGLILGINKLVYKLHGSCNFDAVYACLQQAYDALKK